MRPLLAATFVAIFLVGCRDATSAPPQVAANRPTGPATVELTAEGLANAGVRSARVQPGTFTPRLTTSGTISADPQRIARVGGRVPGRVAAIRVALGDSVRQGQPLLEIDAVELHQVSMEYLTATARARQANDALARQRQLVAERVGAVADLRRAEADAAAAAATLHESEEHLHFLGLTDRDISQMRSRTSHGNARTIVRAPIDGRVGALDVALGQVLAGTEDLVTITQLDSVWVALRIYERDLPSVVRGASVEVRIPGAPERVFSGTLTFLGDLADPTTRTVEARAALANPDGALRPGMSAVASIALAGNPSALWLPAEAVQLHADRPTVFVRTAERRFEVRAVIVGAEQGGFVPVVSGITPGDDVVVHGAFALRGEMERSEMEE